MQEIIDKGFYQRNNETIQNIAHNLIYDNQKKIQLGIGYFIQLFRLKKGPDPGHYVAAFELNKVSLEEVKWKVVKCEKFDSVDEYLDMKNMMGQLKVNTENQFKIIKGN